MNLSMSATALSGLSESKNALKCPFTSSFITLDFSSVWLIVDNLCATADGKSKKSLFGHHDYGNLLAQVISSLGIGRRIRLGVSRGGIIGAAHRAR
jgi:hypothetical protein